MANEFLTTRQVVARMIASAEEVVASFPPDTLRKIVGIKLNLTDETVTEADVWGIGIGGALRVSLILAAKNRLAELEGSESCL